MKKIKGEKISKSFQRVGWSIKASKKGIDACPRPDSPPCPHPRLPSRHASPSPAGMAQITLVGLPTCDTCKKARKALEADGHYLAVRDLWTVPLSEGALAMSPAARPASGAFGINR